MEFAFGPRDVEGLPRAVRGGWRFRVLVASVLVPETLLLATHTCSFDGTVVHWHDSLQDVLGQEFLFSDADDAGGLQALAGHTSTQTPWLMFSRSGISRKS